MRTIRVDDAGKKFGRAVRSRRIPRCGAPLQYCSADGGGDPSGPAYISTTAGHREMRLNPILGRRCLDRAPIDKRQGRERLGKARLKGCVQVPKAPRPHRRLLPVEGDILLFLH